MRTFFCLLFFLQTGISLAQNPTKVLFVGNSITYFNDMPETFEAIANSKGKLAEVTVYAPGGTGFINHATDPNVFEHFREGDWDYIVLQPGSNESPAYSSSIAETLTRARILCDSIYTHNPCVKVLYHEISYGVWGNSAEDLATYNATMDLIYPNLQYLADSTKVFFAPIGESFRNAWNSDQSNMLWGGNGDIHPNAKGSYLAACTFYSSIFQEASLGSSVLNSMTEEEASYYQELADTTVLNNLPDYRINVYQQSTDFDYEFTTNSNHIQFVNLSENVDSVLWNFGNGNSSVENNPSEGYLEAGEYEVSLTSFQHGCMQTVKKIVIIPILTILDVNKTVQWSIYPNPASHYINLEQGHNTSLRAYSYKIYNTTGQLLIQTNQNKIDISHLDQDMYIIQIIDRKKIIQEQLLWLKSN